MSNEPVRFPQRSFDDLGAPLHDVTFCVFDLETTGGSVDSCSITEIGAVKVRGGEVLGTFQTLVNPGCAIPPNITVLTGITDSLVMRAPSMEQVLPAFLEFMGGSVVVGHNVRFDWGFLSAAVRRWGGPMLGNQRVDTLGLARRLLVDETPRFGLGELARRYRLPHQPTHRALDDAQATTDLLHLLIERASAWGVTGLDDLISLPTVAGHPQWRKLSMTNDIPRAPGVYLFHDRDDRVLYVGKATDLRSRVRSYFSSDRRRKVGQLLRETHRVSHQICGNTLEAELLELRLIQRFGPRFNRRNKRPIAPCWVRLTDEAFPRLSIVRTSPPPTAAALGPFSSRAEAKTVVEALHAAFPIRRCSTRIGRRGFEPTDAPCTAAQLGVALCPCSGACSETEYDRVVQSVREAFAGETDLILLPLEAHMHRLAESERFEEAADMRNRAEAIARIVGRQRRIEMLDQIDHLVVEDRRGATIEIRTGGVVDSAVLDRCPGQDRAASSANPMTDPEHRPQSLDEALCVASWLQRNADGVRLVASEGLFASPLPGLPDFKPAAQPSSRPNR